MPRFIVRGSYTSSAMKGMIAKPSDRGEAARKIVEAAGGKMESYYVTTGPSDFMLIATVDDISALLAGLMVVGASGAVSNLETQRAFTADEFTAMQKKAGKIAASYSAPS